MPRPRARAGRARARLEDPARRRTAGRSLGAHRASRSTAARTASCAGSGARGGGRGRILDPRRRRAGAREEQRVTCSRAAHARARALAHGHVSGRSSSERFALLPDALARVPTPAGPAPPLRENPMNRTLLTWLLAGALVASLSWNWKQRERAAPPTTC